MLEGGKFGNAQGSGVQTRFVVDVHGTLSVYPLPHSAAHASHETPLTEKLSLSHDWHCASLVSVQAVTTS